MSRVSIRTISIPLFLATPILVLWAPKSMPTTDMMTSNRRVGEGRKMDGGDVEGDMRRGAKDERGGLGDSNNLQRERHWSNESLSNGDVARVSNVGCFGSSSGQDFFFLVHF
jgi:hypothetical protein